MILGIDPGLSGCCVLLDSEGKYIDHLHMPVMQLGKRREINIGHVSEWIREREIEREQCVQKAFIEDVHSMPKQGSSSTFSFGWSAGALNAMLLLGSFPHARVTPQAWKKRAGVIGKDKDAARVRAIQEYRVQDLNKKGKGQALADAIWIARMGVE